MRTDFWYEIEYRPANTNNWHPPNTMTAEERFAIQSTAEREMLLLAQSFSAHSWRVVEVRRMVKVCRVYTAGAEGGVSNGKDIEHE